MKKLRSFLIDTFEFSQRELNGFLVLLSLLCLLLFLAVSWRHFSTPLALSAEDARELDKLLEGMKSVQVKASTSTYEKKREGFRPAERLFTFDPNEISVAEWQTLGVPKYIAERIEKYRAKGGRFRKKEDLKTIYDFDPAKYTELEAYVQIAESFRKEPFRKEKEKTGFEPEAFRPAERLFTFDPNEISVVEWQTLGVPKYIAERIEKYRAKGGRFRKKEDLKNIYDFDPDKYAELEPYIELPETLEKTAAKHERKPKAKPLERFDINTVDTATLKRIRGIGSGYAARIVRLREELGGFHELKQIQEEVYRFPPETFAALSQYAYVTPSPALRKININTADVETLQSHRYLNYKQAQVIVRYRIQHGSFQSADDLRKIHALPQGLVDKLLPYLTF